MPEYLTDASRLLGIVEERNAELAARRRGAGNRTGAGQPPAAHKSLNRAVVVASVGALEAFCEDLAIRARGHAPGALVGRPWYAIEGSRGIVQTPSSNNIAKLFWTYFHYDPRPDWELQVTCGWQELSGTGTNSRGTTTVYRGTAAAEALDAVVKVRHGFAHQDRANAPAKTPGLVDLTPTGKLSLQSHHAANSIRLVVQTAIQTVHGLSRHVPALSGKLRWKKAGQRPAGTSSSQPHPSSTTSAPIGTKHPF
ncbi:hypothetical protein [Kribbella solani]|uniref:hypothetical protein n=2 Tax=Kribbella solani TaxID=236067 RepID=UPI0029B73DF1|nr:hypothetical protein [Kribbella solani]MDX2973534.1 hypothetical protein [Kribbella solani]